MIQKIHSFKTLTDSFSHLLIPSIIYSRLSNYFYLFLHRCLMTLLEKLWYVSLIMGLGWHPRNSTTGPYIGYPSSIGRLKGKCKYTLDSKVVPKLFSWKSKIKWLIWDLIVWFHSAADVPRSLNSDISYFGVGGKQAIFFIGDATRVREF